MFKRTVEPLSSSTGDPYGVIIEDKTVTAYRGASVIIPCTEGLSNDVTYVAWKKDDDVYSYFYNEQSKRKKKRTFATSKSRRLRLPEAPSEAERDDYSIHISPVIKRDEGVYRCIVGNYDNKRNRVIITRLRVVDRERVVYANAGEPVTVSCGDAPTGQTGRVRWTKDAFLINGQKELTIENVTRTDGGTYVCVLEKVSDTGGDVIGDYYVSTTYVLVQGHSSIDVAAGSTVTLPCEIAGDDVWGRANWLFTPPTTDGQPGESYNVGERHRAGIPSGGGRLAFPLTLEKVQRTSTGLYTCATLGSLSYPFDSSPRDQRYIASVYVNVV